MYACLLEVVLFFQFALKYICIKGGVKSSSEFEVKTSNEGLLAIFLRKVPLLSRADVLFQDSEYW